MEGEEHPLDRAGVKKAWKKKKNTCSKFPVESSEPRPWNEIASIFSIEWNGEAFPLRHAVQGSRFSIRNLSKIGLESTPLLARDSNKIGWNERTRRLCPRAMSEQCSWGRWRARSVVHSAPRHRDGEEEDTVEGVAVPRGETVRDLQNQKTHVQSSEALAYLARFLFSFASLRRFSISW